jgi:hypothetical protein
VSGSADQTLRLWDVVATGVQFGTTSLVVVCIVSFASDVIFGFVNGWSPFDECRCLILTVLTELSSKVPAKDKFIKRSVSNLDTTRQTGKSKPTSSIHQEPHGPTISVSESLCQLLKYRDILELQSLLTLPEKLSRLQFAALNAYPLP